MRSLPILAGLMTAAIATSPAFALDHVTPAQKAYFRNLEVQLWDAWNAHLNPADVAKYYDKNPNNLYFDFSPLEFKGWKQYEETSSKALAGARAAGGHAVTNIHNDFQVIKEGNLVVCAFTFDVTFITGDHSNKSTARETDVWTKKHGHWVILHQHMSFPSGGGMKQS